MHGEHESSALHPRGVVLSQVDGQPGRYRDIAALGRGGMGDVYLSVGPGTAREDRLVGVKRLRSTFASDPEFLPKFLDEARNAARLRHANIAHTREAGFDGRDYFMGREYLDCRS